MTDGDDEENVPLDKEKFVNLLGETDTLLGSDYRLRPHLDRAFDSPLIPAWAKISLRTLFIWAYFQVDGQNTSSMETALKLYKLYMTRPPNPLPQSVIQALEFVADEAACLAGETSCGLTDDGMHFLPFGDRDAAQAIILDLRRHFWRKQKAAGLGRRNIQPRED